MQVVRNLTSGLLTGGMLAAGCEQASAATLLDFFYPNSFAIDERSILGPVPIYDPFFKYEIGESTTRTQLYFTAPITPGTHVFDLTGDVLALTALALTNGVLTHDERIDVYGFSIYLGPRWGTGVTFRDAYDFFLNKTTDLQGATIDGVRLTLSDICLQPTTEPVCWPRDSHPGYLGYKVKIRFQAFGSFDSDPVDVPEPATAAMAATAGLMLWAVRRRRG
jgi:hypothetical protein